MTDNYPFATVLEVYHYFEVSCENAYYSVIFKLRDDGSNFGLE